MQPLSQAQRHAMYGYAKGSVADRMTNEQRKAWKAWLRDRNTDHKVMEAQLSDRRYRKSRHDLSEV